VRFDTLLKTQPKVVRLFQNSLKKDRLVHTYLFEGARGTCKLEAAHYFAAMILCRGEKRPCLECEDCRKILKEVHPSVFIIKPENNVIRKEQVEFLEKEFSLTSISEEKRIYVIDDIDKATASAANSLLKFLEDLDGDKYGILTTENIHNVLSTIRSRSQIISFNQVSKRVIAEELMMKGVDLETSNVLATLSNSVDECLELIGEGFILDLIELAKKVGISIISGQNDPILVLYEEGDFLIKEPNKKYHHIFMDLLITFMNDKLSYLLNQKEEIVFANTFPEIADYLREDFSKALKTVERLLHYKQRLNYNVNLELFYADMLINCEVK
jgi:DNA polymerase-3 subunit delta'